MYHVKYQTKIVVWSGFPLLINKPNSIKKVESLKPKRMSSFGETRDKVTFMFLSRVTRIIIRLSTQFLGKTLFNFAYLPWKSRKPILPYWQCSIPWELRSNIDTSENKYGDKHFLLKPNYFKKQHSSSSFYLPKVIKQVQTGL